MNENTFSKIEPMLDELTEAELIYLMEKRTSYSNRWRFIEIRSRLMG